MSEFMVQQYKKQKELHEFTQSIVAKGFLDKYLTSEDTLISGHLFKSKIGDGASGTIYQVKLMIFNDCEAIIHPTTNIYLAFI